MAHVLGGLADAVQHDPPQLERTEPVPGDDLVEVVADEGGTGSLAGPPVAGADRLDSVVGIEQEARRRRRGEPQLGARGVGEHLGEPDRLHQCEVLDQPSRVVAEGTSARVAFRLGQARRACHGRRRAGLELGGGVSDHADTVSTTLRGDSAQFSVSTAMLRLPATP